MLYIDFSFTLVLDKKKIYYKIYFVTLYNLLT